jgi:hypothetical protein
LTCAHSAAMHDIRTYLFEPRVANWTFVHLC